MAHVRPEAQTLPSQGVSNPRSENGTDLNRMERFWNGFGTHRFGGMSQAKWPVPEFWNKFEQNGTVLERFWNTVFLSPVCRRSHSSVRYAGALCRLRPYSQCFQKPDSAHSGQVGHTEVPCRTSHREHITSWMKAAPKKSKPHRGAQGERHAWPHAIVLCLKEHKDKEQNL